MDHSIDISREGKTTSFGVRGMAIWSEATKGRMALFTNRENYNIEEIRWLCFTVCWVRAGYNVLKLWPEKFWLEISMNFQTVKGSCRKEMGTSFYLQNLNIRKGAPLPGVVESSSFQTFSILWFIMSFFIAVFILLYNIYYIFLVLWGYTVHF